MPLIYVVVITTQVRDKRTIDGLSLISHGTAIKARLLFRAMIFLSVGGIPTFITISIVADNCTKSG